MSDSILRLSLCAGPVTKTTLEPWVTTFSGLKARLGVPEVGIKGGSYFITPTGTRRNGKYGDLSDTADVIVLDGDKRIDPATGEVFTGAPDPALVHAALVSLGVPHIIYTSHSNALTKAEVEAHNALKRTERKAAQVRNPKLPDDPDLMDTGGLYGPDLHRWRAVIPCTVTKATFKGTVARLCKALNDAGVPLENVGENSTWGLAWYLPRVPDQARLGLFRFYEHGQDGDVFVDVPAATVPEPATVPAAAVPAAAVPAAAVPATVPFSLPAKGLPAGARDPIKELNACTHPGLTLGHYGYTRYRGGLVLPPGDPTPYQPGLDCWLWPGSSTGVPGVKLLPDNGDGVPRIFSHHPGDPLAAGEKAHDAFDCWRILGCGGDMSQALAWSTEINEHNRRLAAQSYFAPGETPITVKDAVAEVNGALTAIGAQRPFDAGALMDPKLIAWLAVIKHHDPVEWARVDHTIRETLKANRAGNLVKSIIKAVDDLNAARKVATERARAAQVVSETPVTFNKPVDRDLFVIWNDKGVPRMVHANVAASTCITYISGMLTFDPSIGMWYGFTGKYWRLLDEEHGPSGVFQLLLNAGSKGCGYDERYKNGLIHLVEGSRMLKPPSFNRALLPFSNGILDVNTRILAPITPDNAQAWVLPYDYNPQAECPFIEAWLLAAMDGDAEMVKFMKVIAACVLRRMSYTLEVFFYLKGLPGTGKGSFLRLLLELVGTINAHATDLKRMNLDKFETANFRDKPLVFIADQPSYDGGIGILLNMTGQDPIPFERKHKNRSAGGASFTFDGTLVMCGNYAMHTKEQSIALDRRQRIVAFDKPFTVDEGIKWESAGAEDQLRRELPGFVNAVLAIPVQDLVSAVKRPPEGVLLSNRAATRSNNTVAAWLVDCCKPVPADCEWMHRLHIGGLSEKSLSVRVPATTEEGKPADGTHTETFIKDADTKAYPNYVRWCRSNGAAVLSVNKYAETLRATLHQFGVTWPKGSTRDKHGSYVPGVILKDPDDGMDVNLFEPKKET